MPFQDLLLDQDGPVWVMTVNRVSVRNAMGRQTWEELDQALAMVEENPDCRALVLTAAGGNFIAGGDLKEVQALTTGPEVTAWSQRAKAVLNRLSRLPIPVIAAIEGHAIGGGCEVALACDLRVAGESARFSFWEIRNAVTTGWGGGRRLLDLVGRATALELLLTGETIRCERAMALGLVNLVVPDGRALAAAISLGQQIAAQPPLAVRKMKELIDGVAGLPPAAADDLETELFVQTWLSADHQEAVRSFLERRRPRWHGR